MDHLKKLKAKEAIGSCLEKSVELILSGTILGHLPSGKNQYEISGNRLYKNSELGVYGESFHMQMNLLRRKANLLSMLDYSVALYCKIFFQSFRRDVDTILFCDLLQKNGLIKNDRKIRVKFLDGIEVDAKNPRVEFELYKI